MVRTYDGHQCTLWCKNVSCIHNTFNVDTEVKKRIGFETCANVAWIGNHDLYNFFLKRYGRTALMSMAIEKVKIECPEYKKKERYTTRW
jgi:hypothetical protein